MIEPNEITGLQLWLDADELSLEDGDSVSTWLGRDGTSVNATGAVKKPVMKMLNDKKFVYFDGSVGHRMDLSSNIFANNNPKTIFLVAHSLSNGHIIGQGTSSSPYYTYLKGIALANNKYAISARNNGSGAVAETASTHIGSTKIVTGVFQNQNTSIKTNSNSAVADSTNNLNYFNYSKATIGASDGSNSNAYVSPYTGYIGEIIIFDRVLTSQEIGDMEQYLYFKWFSLNKIILLSGQNYYTYDTDWVNLGITEPTEQVFLNDGVDYLTLKTLPPEKFYELDSPIELLFYTDNTSVTEVNVKVTAHHSPIDNLEGSIEVVAWTDEENASRSINYNAVPLDQLILPTKDINIRSVENIDSFTLNVTQAEQGAVTTAVSFDSGVTWYTRTAGAWSEIDILDMKTAGMTPTVLNALTAAEWTELRGLSDTVRFAYLLSAADVSDTLEVQDLISQMDMRGTWKKAAHPTVYDYEYPYNDQLRVTIFVSGDYKINY